MPESAVEGHVQLVVAIERAHAGPARAIPLSDTHDGLALLSVTNGRPNRTRGILDIREAVLHDVRELIALAGTLEHGLGALGGRHACLPRHRELLLADAGLDAEVVADIHTLSVAAATRVNELLQAGGHGVGVLDVHCGIAGK
ncbi:hypothetical protein LCH21_00955 [Patescibacteria group bacterium]|nr:hypothetical protein [Patescibacteria group bacterium]